MKKIIIVLSLLTSILITKCGETTNAQIIQVNTNQVDQIIADREDLLILDVRTPEEWANGVIDGALKLNFYDGDFIQKLKMLETDQPTLVYCKSGGRSMKAATKMKELGFKEVLNLEGGYSAYSSK